MDDHARKAVPEVSIENDVLKDGKQNTSVVPASVKDKKERKIQQPKEEMKVESSQEDKKPAKPKEEPKIVRQETPKHVQQEMKKSKESDKKLHNYAPSGSDKVIGTFGI